MFRPTLLLCFAFALPLCSASADDKPLQVFILAGQSNMQGHAQVRTLEHIGMDPKTAPMLADLLEDGEPRTCQQVWISSIGHDGKENERHGRLSADFGAAGRDPKVGPEYAFGIYMQKMLDQPILIIKTAWGGKSLNTDFRPPSAGSYKFNPQQLANFEKQKKDIADIKRQKAEATGRYYHLMIDHVKKVTSDIKRVYPNYDESAGHELAGFVWFQGWNDMVDRGTYPNRDKPGGYAEYSKALAHFIRDVRNDLAAPNLPFVIGVMGTGGPVEAYGVSQQRYKNVHSEFRKAMATPAKMPEFEDNVVAIRTETYWDQQLGELSSRWGQVNAEKRRLQKDEAITPEERKEQLEAFSNKLYTPEERKILDVGKSNAEYHYLGSAKILCQIGKAFAEALKD